MIKLPQERLANLLAFFGWQGGTIHQIAKETNVPVNVLISGKPSESFFGSDYSLGSICLETCSRPWRAHLGNKRKGNVDWWLGVADAVSVCKE